MLDTGQIPLTGNALEWFQQGLTAAATEDYKEAVAWFNQVLELHPDFYEAWYERGLALERWGYYIEAIASFDRALRLKPSDKAAAEIWHDQGNALQYGLGKYLEAIDCYDQALRLNPQQEFVWHNRGNALLYGLSRPEDALGSYSRVIQINPNNALAWRNRGNALIEMRRYEEAMDSYDRTLSISPDDHVAWHARNLAAQKSGLADRQPTTFPISFGTGFNDPTFVESQESNEAQVVSSEFFLGTDTASPSQPLPRLVIEDDWGKREIFLSLDQYVVGRDPQADICLHSKFVSRQHAVLTRLERPDGSYTYRIIDGNIQGTPSTNGVTVNGHRCRTTELRMNDVIVLGPQICLRFYL